MIVAKTYVFSRQERDPVGIEQCNKEIDEAMAQIDAGEFYIRKEVVEMSKTW